MNISRWHLGIISFWCQLGSSLHWSCWYLGINYFLRQLGYPLVFAIPGYPLTEIPLCFPLLGFNLLIVLCETIHIPVEDLLYFYFLGELYQLPKDKIVYVPLNPVANYMYISNLNTRLCVGSKTLSNLSFKLKFQTQIPNLNFKLKFQTQTWITKTKIFPVLPGHLGFW